MQGIVNTTTLEEFFKEEVRKALHENPHTSLSHDAEYYLVNLLSQFSRYEKLYVQDENNPKQEKALALQFFDAILKSRDQRIPHLKKMGDVALYTSGFFSDNLANRCVGLKYYINMGHTAYSSISHLISAKNSLSHLFEELALKFKFLVDLLMTISSYASLNNENDLLKLFERYHSTGSPQALEKLKQKGLDPLISLDNDGLEKPQ